VVLLATQVCLPGKFEKDSIFSPNDIPSPNTPAPEILRGQEYDELVDVYSLGMVLWELLTRTTPFAGQSFMEIIQDVLQGKRPPIPPHTPSEYSKLIKKCWSDSKRPSLETLIEYFNGELGTDNIV